MHEDPLEWLHFCTLQAGTVTDEDIDAIIEKGERDTEQLNQKLQVRPADSSSMFCTESTIRSPRLDCAPEQCPDQAHDLTPPSAPKQEFSKDAMKFTMDGGFNAYDFKDEEEDDADIEKLKALAGAGWPQQSVPKSSARFNRRIFACFTSV